MVRFFASAAKARAWFERNHERAEEQWIGFYKVGATKKGASYAEVLDQALCFGWIDGVRKRIEDESYMIRFSPRTRRSGWSKVNIKRFGELRELGLVRPAGLKAFDERDLKKSAVLHERENARLEAGLEARFRENAAAWMFFEAQPPGYRRLATWWIMSAKREETRLRRLEVLIGESESGRRVALVPGAAKRGE